MCQCCAGPVCLSTGQSNERIVRVKNVYLVWYTEDAEYDTTAVLDSVWYTRTSAEERAEEILNLAAKDEVVSATSVEEHEVYW